MLFDNTRPRYLPHVDDPRVLLMGLSPLAQAPWIETDSDIAHYHRHKLARRESGGGPVYRCTESSLPAQREMFRLLLRHLVEQQADNYRVEEDRLHCVPGNFSVPLCADEPLWTASLWIADDLVLMENIEGNYCLTAASLCSPSHWRLQDKFGRPMREIHDAVPGFHDWLTPRVDRFFDQLRAGQPFVRYNWAVQADDALDQDPDREVAVGADTPLFYRTERQSLTRLPESAAIAFTIRVYLHPLDALRQSGKALPLLLEAIDTTPPELFHYKAFDNLAPALEKYRQ